jgi:putative SOS response-associated peptidase YedK
MCNLITCNATSSEIASAFKARQPANINAGSADVYPGGPGMIVREQDGERIVQAATWGFPLRLKSMKPGSKPKPVNNITDLSSYLWRFVAPKPEHRCIIPISGFAEPEGQKGAKTRTWFKVKDRPVFAWAGMWKQSDEWGAVYSGLMTESNAMVAPFQDRMPALLHEDEYDRWLRGSLDDVLALQARRFPEALMVMERTADLWVERKA